MTNGNRWLLAARSSLPSPRMTPVVVVSVDAVVVAGVARGR